MLHPWVMNTHASEKQQSGTNMFAGADEGGEQNSPPGSGAFFRAFILHQNLWTSWKGSGKARSKAQMVNEGANVIVEMNSLIKKSATWYNVAGFHGVLHGLWLKDERAFPTACSKVRICFWITKIHRHCTKASHTKARIPVWGLLLSPPRSFLGRPCSPLLSILLLPKGGPAEKHRWQLLPPQAWHWAQKGTQMPKQDTHSHGAPSWRRGQDGEDGFTGAQWESWSSQVLDLGDEWVLWPSGESNGDMQIFVWKCLSFKTLMAKQNILNSAWSLPICTWQWQVGGQEAGGWSGPGLTSPFLYFSLE